MGQLIERHSIEEDFAVKSSTVPHFNIGEKVTVADKETGLTATYMYVKSHGMSAYQPYVLVYQADGIKTAAPATSTITKIIGIPQTAIANNSYGWVAIGGVCKAKTGIQAKGDTLEVLNSGTTLVVDGTSGSPAETSGTVAISVEKATAAATVLVNLLNKRVTIAAS